MAEPVAEEFQLETTYQPTQAGEYEFSEKQKKALLSDLKKTHQDLRKFRMEDRRRQTKLELYVGGRQARDGDTGNFVGHEIAGSPSDTKDVDDEFLIINDVRRVHMSNMQRLTAYNIQCTVTPKSKQPSDKRAARLGRMVLSTIFQEIGEEKFKIKTARILGLYGVCFFKTYFDPSLGRLIAPLLPTTDPMGVPQYDKENLVPEGQVVIEPVSPRNVLLPAWCQDIDKADELEEVHVETTNFIWRRYKISVKAEAINFDKWDGPAVGSSKGDQGGFEVTQPENSVLLRTRYIMPCERYQKGAVITYTDNHILESTTLLPRFDKLPWEVAQCIYDDRTPYADSLLWDMIPLQDAINGIGTAMMTHIKMFGDGKMTIPLEGNIDPKKINNKTGDHVPYSGGPENKPEPIKWPALPDSHSEIFSTVRGLEMSLMSAHDIQRVNKAQSGNAISNLQEIDDTIMKPALNSLAGAVTRSGCTALKLVEDEYSTDRTIRMTGEQGWKIETAFRGKMLDGNYQAKISLMTSMPTNPASKREYVESLAKTALPPSALISRDEARLYLEVGNTDDLLEAIQKEDEIAEGIIETICDYPKNYAMQTVMMPGQMEQTPLGPIQGPPVPTKKMVCTWIPDMIDNHQMIVKKFLPFMRENLRELPQPVQEALKTTLEFSQKFLAASMTPGSVDHSMMGQDLPPPEGADAAGPGREPAGPPPGADSVHSSGEQPNRSMIPEPANTGLQAN